VIDLANDRLLKRFEIPQSIVEIGRGLASITIDVGARRCNDAYAYIPDLVNRRLHVYHLRSDRIWSFEHSFFNFDPLSDNLNIGGQTFRWDDGIFSATLGSYKPDGSRDVFFHPMASTNEFVVSNRVLQQEFNAARSDHGDDFHLLGTRGPSTQSTMHKYDPRTGVIFFAEVQKSGVGCWKTSKPFSTENHGSVYSNSSEMIYPSDLTVSSSLSICNTKTKVKCVVVLDRRGGIHLGDVQLHAHLCVLQAGCGKPQFPNLEAVDIAGQEGNSL